MSTYIVCVISLFPMYTIHHLEEVRQKVININISYPIKHHMYCCVILSTVVQYIITFQQLCVDRDILLTVSEGSHQEKV